MMLSIIKSLSTWSLFWNHNPIWLEYILHTWVCENFEAKITPEIIVPFQKRRFLFLFGLPFPTNQKTNPGPGDQRKSGRLTPPGSGWGFGTVSTGRTIRAGEVESVDVCVFRETRWPVTLKLTADLKHLKIDGKGIRNSRFLLAKGLFSGAFAVSFRECIPRENGKKHGH